MPWLIFSKCNSALSCLVSADRDEGVSLLHCSADLISRHGRVIPGSYTEDGIFKLGVSHNKATFNIQLQWHRHLTLCNYEDLHEWENCVVALVHLQGLVSALLWQSCQQHSIEVVWAVFAEALTNHIGVTFYCWWMLYACFVCILLPSKSPLISVSRVFQLVWHQPTSHKQLIRCVMWVTINNIVI